MTEHAIVLRARERAAAKLTPGSMPFIGVMTGQWDLGDIVRREIPAATAELMRAMPEAEEE